MNVAGEGAAEARRRIYREGREKDGPSAVPVAEGAPEERPRTEEDEEQN